MKLFHLLLFSVFTGLLFSCTTAVTFKEDYFNNPDRLNFDNNLVGNYKTTYQNIPYSIIIWEGNKKSYQIHILDKDERVDRFNNPFNVQIIKIEDIYLVKISGKDFEEHTGYLLLKILFKNNELVIDGMVINFETDFFRSLIENQFLEGEILNYLTKSGSNFENIQIQADYDEFIQFVKSNMEIIIEKINNTTDENGTFILTK